MEQPSKKETTGTAEPIASDTNRNERNQTQFIIEPLMLNPSEFRLLKDGVLFHIGSRQECEEMKARLASGADVEDDA